MNQARSLVGFVDPPEAAGALEKSTLVTHLPTCRSAVWVRGPDQRWVHFVGAGSDCTAGTMQGYDNPGRPSNASIVSPHALKFTDGGVLYGIATRKNGPDGQPCVCIFRETAEIEVDCPLTDLLFDRAVFGPIGSDVAIFHGENREGTVVVSETGTVIPCKEVLAAAISSTGRTAVLVLDSSDKQLRLYVDFTKPGIPLGSAQVHIATCSTMKWHPDGHLLGLCTCDGKLIVVSGPTEGDVSTIDHMMYGREIFFDDAAGICVRGKPVVRGEIGTTGVEYGPKGYWKYLLP